MKVIILDQFTGPSPYGLSITPMKFAELEERVTLGEFNTQWGVRPRVTEVPEDYRPEMCETVYAENEDGNAYAWRYNWDSSG
jgi:hypothetical protein